LPRPPRQADLPTDPSRRRSRLMDRFLPTEVDPMTRILMAMALALLATSAHAGPFRRPTARPTSCVGGACSKAAAVTTAPVRVVRKAVGR
jgi:hypothetical protein